MKTAVISDIHSNLEALEAVLRRIDDLEVSTILCLGDIVGYGPHPNECVDLIRSRCSAVVKGNHDSGTCGETPLDHFNQFGRAAIEWTQENISQENLDYLRELPLKATLPGITIVHSSPVNPGEWEYILTLNQAIDCFNSFDTPVCFIGHTHVPIIVADNFSAGDFLEGRRHLINAGSVGQPRDHNPRSAFGVFDEEEKTYNLHRVAYDTKNTAKAIRKAGLPSYLGKRLHRGV
ncbi:MAG: metallophosphatase family protein [Ignavibacteria bacterium]|nr:metallophosphatase family protein [Ignavibacteria bacterium]